MKRYLLRFAMQLPCVVLTMHGAAAVAFDMPLSMHMPADKFLGVLFVGVCVGTLYDLGEKMK